MTYSTDALLEDARARIEALEAALRGFLDCPEIADCAPEDKDPETDALERTTRALLQEKADG